MAFWSQTSAFQTKINTIGQKFKFLTNYLNFLLCLFLNRYFPPSAEHNGPQPIIGPLLLHPRQLVGGHDVLGHRDGVTLHCGIFNECYICKIAFDKVNDMKNHSYNWNMIFIQDYSYRCICCVDHGAVISGCHQLIEQDIILDILNAQGKGGVCCSFLNLGGFLWLMYSINDHVLKFGAEPTCDGSILCVLSDDVSHIAALAANDFPCDFPLDSLRNIHWNEEC